MQKVDVRPESHGPVLLAGFHIVDERSQLAVAIEFERLRAARAELQSTSRRPAREMEMSNPTEVRGGATSGRGWGETNRAPFEMRSICIYGILLDEKRRVDVCRIGV